MSHVGRKGGWRAEQHRFALALVALIYVISAAALDAQPGKPIDLSGRWLIDIAQSDDPERLLQQRLQEEARRAARREREARAGSDDVLEPIAPTPSARWRQQQRETLRRMIGVSDHLLIQQRADTIDIHSAVDARQFTPGAQSHVSMPDGDLAELRSGWDGAAFVVERAVRRGARVTERFQILKTGELEYRMRWRGETELAGLDIRRVYHRTSDAGAERSETVGPIP